MSFISWNKEVRFSKFTPVHFLTPFACLKYSVATIGMMSKILFCNPFTRAFCILLELGKKPC